MFRRACLIGTLAVLIIAPALWAQNDDKDKPKQEKKVTPAEEYRALVRDYQTVQQAYIRALQAAKTDADRQETFKKAPKPQEFAGRFLDLAKNNSQDAVAVDALLWVAQNAATGPQGNEAVGILVEEHIENAKIATLFQRQAPSLSPGMEKLARAVLEKNPDKTVQRQACLALAVHMKNRRQADESEKFFQRVVDEFADVNSLVQVVQQNANGPSGEEAIEALIKDHIKSPGFGASMLQLGAGRQPSAGVEKLLRTVMTKSEDRDAKGGATFALAQYLKSQGDMARNLKSADEARLKQYEGFYGAEVIKGLLETDPAKFSEEIEGLLEQVVEKYADVQGQRGTLGDAAKPELFEIRFLSIGKVVPEIEAEDTDGESFKLSDYRGKVVMIDFWGHW